MKSPHFRQKYYNCKTVYVNYLPNRQKRRLNVFHGSVCNINTICQHNAVKKHIYIFKSAFSCVHGRLALILQPGLKY